MAGKTGRPQPIVAELGRPETPQETADRKAESSRNYRQRKTINNFWFSLIVTVGLVILIVIMVPRNDTPRDTTVDFRAIGAQAQEAMPVDLAVPELPSDWTSNAAEIRTAPQDDIKTWYVGLITPSKQYLGLTQAVDSNATWLVTELKQSVATGTVSIDGVQWTEYDNRTTDRDVGNVKYALTTEAGRSTFVIYGTASPEEAAALASSITDTVKAATTTTESDR